MTEKCNISQNCINSLQEKNKEQQAKINSLEDQVKSLNEFKANIGSIKGMADIEGPSPTETINIMKELHDKKSEYCEALDNYLFNGNFENGFDKKLLDGLEKFKILNKARIDGIFNMSDVEDKRRNLFGYNSTIGCSPDIVAGRIINIVLKTSDNNSWLCVPKYINQARTNAFNLLKYALVDSEKDSVTKQLQGNELNWKEKDSLRSKFERIEPDIKRELDHAFEDVENFQEDFNKSVESKQKELKPYNWPINVYNSKYEPWGMTVTYGNGNSDSWRAEDVRRWRH